MAQSAEPHHLGKLSRAFVFLWRGKVWNSILFRSIGSCGFRNVELSLNLGSPNREFQWNEATGIPLWEALWLKVQN